jgi:endonuclease YncB( thermonuclease family)
MNEPRVWDYRVTELLRTVDGDTADLTVEKRMDFGFRLIEDKTWSARFRLLNVDTWETNQAGGAAATRFADQWIAQAIYADVLRGQTFKTDSFGRWLIDLYRTDTGEHLADALIREGHGRVYRG